MPGEGGMLGPSAAGSTPCEGSAKLGCDGGCGGCSCFTSHAARAERGVSSWGAATRKACESSG
jgi:secreted trypsin-like serine protease